MGMDAVGDAAGAGMRRCGDAGRRRWTRLRPPGATSDGAQVTNALPALQTSLWSKAGTTVTAVRFAGVTFGEKNAIVSELKQKAGEPLDPDKVRADMRRLFASGLYVNISVNVVPEGNGVALVYSGTAAVFCGAGDD